MKNLLLFATGACLIACQQPSAPVVDKEAAKKEVIAMFDAYSKAFAEENATALGAFLTDDGIFYGTDPSELWSREQVMKQLETFAADTTISPAFTESSRAITITDNGNGATIVTHAIYPFMSQTVAGRFVGHAINVGGAWKFDLVSYAFTPKNGDVEKINSVVK